MDTNLISTFSTADGGLDPVEKRGPGVRFSKTVSVVHAWFPRVFNDNYE